MENYKIAYIDEPLLLIHQEGERVQRTFDQSEEYTRHYLTVFEPRLQKLSDKNKKRVITVISLERARLAIQMGEKKKAAQILKEGKIGLWAIARYIIYLTNRMITHKSYGFSI